MPTSDLGSRANPYPTKEAAAAGRRKYHRFYRAEDGVQELPAAQWNKNRLKGGGNRRPVNEFMRLQMAAKAEDAPSFRYNNKTYRRKETKTGLPYYSAN